MAKKKVTLDYIDHHDTRRMEFFLNALDDELKEIPFNWKEMKMADRMSGACRFSSMTSHTPLAITVFFCNSYAEASEIAEANCFPSTANAKWSINGTLMYLVETEDKEKLSGVLSLFAGKE